MDSSSDTDEFFFESSHLALRSNSDYLKLMRHLTALCAQRIQIQKDIEVITKAQRKAINDPQSFVEMIKNDSLNLPQPIEISEVAG